MILQINYIIFYQLPTFTFQLQILLISIIIYDLKEQVMMRSQIFLDAWQLCDRKQTLCFFVGAW